MKVISHNIPVNIGYGGFLAHLEANRILRLNERYPGTDTVYPNGYVKKCGQKGFNYFEGFTFGMHHDTFKRPEIDSFICVGWFHREEPVDVYVYRVCKVEDNCIPTIWGEEINHFTLF